MNQLLTSDVIFEVLKFFTPKELCQLALLSKHFCTLTNNEYLWKQQSIFLIQKILSSFNVYKKPNTILPSTCNNWKNYHKKLYTIVLSCGYNRGPHDWGLEKMPNEVDYGQLGLGIDLNGPKCVNTLYLIPTMIGKDVIKVASTGYHTMMLTRDGKVFACGSNAFGQLGCGDRKSRCTPVAVNGLPPIKDIVCGYAFSAAITRDGKLYTWG